LREDQDLNKALKDIFGFSEFRSSQERVVRDVLAGKNTLLIMPTGMGKSLCYQLPARILGGLTLVISPLIALMKDQVDAALKRGFKTAFINSTLDRNERESRYRKLAAGAYELLYVTPERFRKPEFKAALAEAIQKQGLSLLAIDEAHCISSWGHDFRPDFTRLGDYRREMGEPLTLALTATATPEVQKDILKQLGLSEANCDTINEGLSRPNLEIAVHHVHGEDEKVRAVVGLRFANSGPAIIYFSLVQSLRSFSEQLHRLNIPHVTYHGQLQDRERRQSQERFLEAGEGEPDSLILATPAFGLGVDKPNVRQVIHAELPGSIEAYYQEIGRAGRDKLPSQCTLLFDPDDISIQSDFLKWGNPDPGFIRAVYNLVERYPEKIRADGFDFLRTQMNFYNRRDFRVETSLNLLERWDSVEVVNPKEIRALEDPPAEFLDEQKYQARFKAQQKKLYDVSAFAQADEGCRMKMIHSYFGQTLDEPCGKCDLCQKTS
jgi:ATP-dependent DNA helicase RecQ